MFEKKEKTIIASVTFLNGFVTKNNNGNYGSFFQWFYCEKGDGNNVITFFYGSGGAVKKVMAINYCHFFILFFFFLLWCFWFSSLKLKINNEMMVFFNVETCNG